MQAVRLGTTVAELPTSWRELSLKRYINLIKWNRQDFPALCAALLDNKLALSADTASLEALTPFLTWIQEPNLTTFADLPDTVMVKGKSVKYPVIIAKEPFVCKMYMQKHITALIEGGSPVHDALFEAMPFTLACYLYTRYTGKPFDLDAVNDFQKVTEELSMTKAVPLAQEYHRQNALLNQRWKDALSAEYEDVEVKAGIKKFERFGIWGTTYNLAQTLHRTREQVEQMPYNEVFLSLTMEKQKREYQIKLKKLLKPKTPTK